MASHAYIDESGRRDYVVCALPVAATLFISRHPVDRDGRSEIMRRMVTDLTVEGLVIESGVGQDERDRTTLDEAVRKAGWKAGSATGTCRRGRSRCAGCRTRSPGPGARARTGVVEWRH